MNEIEQLELEVQGMTCDACARHVTKALQEVEGVVETAVPGWQSGKATVKASPGVTAEALAAAVAHAGYSATIKSRQPLNTPGSRNGSYDYDLMVIGGGSAGFAAAIKAAELGYHTAIVEAGTMGGTCVNVGCVPSKTLIRAVETAHQAGTHRFQGIHTIPGPIEWPQVIAQKDELVTRLRQGKYADVLAGYPDIEYIEGYARLTGKNSVEINGPFDAAQGKLYTPYRILIATGARPWAPPIEGLAEAGYLDSTAVLDLQERPSSLIVLGANAVGLELAQTYARAGTFVTVVELLPRIAPFEDEAISAALAGYLEEEGLRILTGFATKQVQKENGRYHLTGIHQDKEVTLDAEQLLVATGRRPNTANMGLEENGVKLGRRGEILVDETLRTGNPFVYAAGDVTGQDMFVYVAAYAGGLAAENALNGLSNPLDTGYIPRITFTDPQVASAGLTEAQAIERGHNVKVSTLAMSHVPRALAARDTRGLIKLVADADSDRLLGAHILAPEGGELIQTAVLAIRFGITVSQLRQTIFPYLTNVEGIKLALLGFEKDVALLSCCAG
ncbi:MAG: mercury(II) reductase [Chloroflexi bacterium]|nr:mercury(II) reductase [Ardenticatenaceae bacterium]MBL1129414.1 mercury(II) reductase [Chloroflexota bacterium]NOG35494.1 mercury(II) reductase [Chloroflexota bacterium]GIK57443.1 MAG: mercuric reductase [Chloroflexota bacterium]